MRWAETRPLSCEYNAPQRCASTRNARLLVLADHPAGVYCEKHQKEMEMVWIRFSQR